MNQAVKILETALADVRTQHASHVRNPSNHSDAWRAHYEKQIDELEHALAVITTVLKVNNKDQQ